MKEIAGETMSEVENVTNAMLVGLQRIWTEGERLEAEMIASLLVRARRQRGCGRSDLEEMRAATDLLKNSVFRSPGPAMRAAERASEQHKVLNAEGAHFEVSAGTVEFKRD